MKMRHKSSVPVIIKINFINDLKKYNLLTPDLEKNFLITENKIIANTECFINVDINDYADGTFIESKDYYLVPGIITITAALDNTKNWTFPFNYQIRLLKTKEIEGSGKVITIRYNPGDVILEQKFLQKNPDVSIMEKLLEGQAKYINKPEILVLALLEYLDGMDMVITETIVQNMFRDTIDATIPARLTDYTDFQIIGQKKLPFVTSWINALSFENVKKAIQYGLLSGQDAENDPITKILNEKYATLE